jgi:hypothetical protein
MALVSIGTFLLSKEYFVIEHDFYVGLALAAVLTGEEYFVIEHDFYVGLALAAVLTGGELGILSDQCWGSGTEDNMPMGKLKEKKNEDKK